MSSISTSYNKEFLNALRACGGTLAISVYQAGKILLLSAKEDQVTITPIAYKKPMGIAVNEDKIAIATLDELHTYRHVDSLAKQMDLDGKQYERAYFPRNTFYTGAIDLHDIQFVTPNTILGVSTSFSCLCSFESNFNFKPQWKPYFISEITPEDKCHLNGMAAEKGQPKYVTALGQGDTKGSWRENITTGGILMDVAKNEIIADRLAMPHSPKVIGNSIVLLESAKGELVHIDRTTHKKSTVCKINGMVRGLAIMGNTAFIGVSKVREKSKTATQLTDDVKAEFASIHAIDITSGFSLGAINFKSHIEEIYDIQCIPNTQSVAIFGLYDDRHKQGISIPDNAFWKSSSD